MSPSRSSRSRDHGRDRHGHGAEVHGHVVAHGDDALLGVEEGAGVVAALLDVGRDGGAAQGGAHLFGDGVDGALEDGEFDGADGDSLMRAPRSTRLRRASTRRRRRAAGRWRNCIRR